MEWILVVGCLVSGCGDESPAARPSAAPTPRVAATTDPAPGVTRLPGNPQLFARAERLLGSVGVRDVAETEPSHGSQAVALHGEWQGHELLAGVVPTRRAMPVDEAVLRSYRVRGLEVRVLDSPPYVVHAVELGRDHWAVVVPDGDALTEELVRSLVRLEHPPPLDESPAAMVARADNLYGVRVTRTGDRLDVVALWGVGCDHDGCTPAVLVRQHDEEKTYEVGSYDELQKALWTDDEPPENPFGDGYLAQRATSLKPGVEALVGGGDGATVLPFELVARDGGPPERVRTPRREQLWGQPVVLADGRLLVALTDGLWASDGDDWTTYSPWAPAFAPVLAKAPRGTTPFRGLGASLEEDPVVWLETWDARVYVSTDDARSFTELPVR